MAKKPQIDATKALTDALKELAKQTDDTEHSFKTLGEAIKYYAKEGTEKFEKGIGKMSSGLLFTIGAMKGFKKSLTAGWGITKISIGLVQSLASSVLGLADSFIGFTIEGFRTLMNEVNTIMKLTLAAIEGLQNSFGNLSVGVGKASLNFAKGATILGKNAYRYHDVLDAIREAVDGTAAPFRELITRMSGAEQKAFGNALVFMTKGLHLSGEQIDGLGVYALSTGTKIQTLTDDFFRAGLEISQATGHTAIDVSKSMADMIGDIESFGLVSVDVAKKTVKQMKNLGAETKALAGMAKHFDTFKNAAESAGNLAAVLNMRIDSFALMKATDVERVEMFRESLFASGQTFESLSRPAQRFLASQAQLDMKTSALVFSLENQNKSYDELKKNQKKAISPQEKMANIMDKMYKNIARLTKYIPDLVSFWEAFQVGIKRALSWTGPFAAMLNKVWFAMQRTFEMAGEMTGIFIKSFPGIMTTIKGFSELFSASHFKGLTGDLLKVWKVFINTSMTDFSGLFKNLNLAFTKFTSGAAGQKIVSGFKTFMLAVRNTIIFGIDIASKYAEKGITALVDILTGKRKLGTGTSKFEKFIEPLVEVMKDAWKRLKGPVYSLVSTIVSQALAFLKEKLSNASTETQLIIAAWLLAPAILEGLVMIGAQWAGKLVLSLGSAIGAGPLAIIAGLTVALNEVTSWLDADGVGIVRKWGSKIFGNLVDIFSNWNKKSLVNIVSQYFGGVFSLAIDGMLTLPPIRMALSLFDATLGKLMGVNLVKNLKGLQKKIEKGTGVKTPETRRDEALKKARAAAKEKRIREKELLNALTTERPPVFDKDPDEQLRAAREAILKGEDEFYDWLRKWELDSSKRNEEIKIPPMLIRPGEQIVDSAKAAKEEVENAIAGVEDLTFLKKIEKIDPKKLEELRKTFDTKIKPEVFKIKDIMEEILKEFENVSVSRMEDIINSINMMKYIPKSLTEYSKLSKGLSTLDVAEGMEATVQAVSAMNEVIKYHEKDFVVSKDSFKAFNDFSVELSASHDAFNTIKKSIKAVASMNTVHIEKARKAIDSVLGVISSRNIPTQQQITRFKDSMKALQEYKADVIDIGKAISDTQGTSVKVASVKTADGKVDMNLIISLNIEGHALNNVLTDIYGVTTRYKNRKQAGQ